jgi:hypothetical protein
MDRTANVRPSGWHITWWLPLILTTVNPARSSAGKGSSEQALARRLFGRLGEDWLLIADRGFYNWPDWQAAATGAALLWRVKADLRLPVLELLPDGSYPPRSRPTSPTRATSTSRGGTVPTPASSAEPGTIPTESNDQATPAPDTTGLPRSSWSTCPPRP